MKTMLQIAIDIPDISKAIKIAVESIRNGADIVEAGTPLIKMYGMLPVKLFKSLTDEKLVLADLKTLDAGGLEAELAFSHGADIISISALADDQTIKDAINVARKFKKEVCVDLLNVKNLEQRVSELLEMDIDYLLIHLGLDQQKKGLSIVSKVKEIVDLIPKEKLSVAGGINVENIEEIMSFEPRIIIVGGAVYKARDPGYMVKKLREIIG